MRYLRSVLIPAVLFLLPGIGQTGWVPLTSGTGNVLCSVYFPVDAQIGYAVGDTGTILKTTNGARVFRTRRRPLW